MAQALASPGDRLRSTWARLSPLPGGKWLFGKVLGFMNPYSGALGARVEELKPGYAKLVLHERRGIHNHLNSVHAIALANAGEMASGLAMLSALPPTARGIVTHIAIEFLKKARGTLTAQANVELPDITVNATHQFVSTITDEAGDIVARVTATWKIGPVPVKGS